MAELICNTSPIQYLHQLSLLDDLSRMVNAIVVPMGVVDELDAGRAKGVDLPDIRRLDYITMETPRGADLLPLVTDLGVGEKQALALALENPGAVVVLDDGLARSFAESLSIPLTGTLGILVDMKRAGIIDRVADRLNELDRLGFRLSRHTRNAVLDLAEERT